MTERLLPALQLILRRCNHPAYLEISLDAISLILERWRNARETLGDLNKILDSLIQKRRSPEFDAARKQAGYLMLRIKTANES